MLQNDQSDEDLMVLYQGGSEEAFRILYDRHSGKIFGYLKSKTRSEQEANDFFQEVFVKIHKSKHLYNRTLPVLPWIFSVTHSVMIDGFRKIERKSEILDYDFDQIPSANGERLEHLAEVTPHLKHLPENQRAAIQMRYVDEKTFDDIARTLKTSPLNVRQMISRGVRHLKTLVKDGGRP